MCDECTDASNREQLTICIRWVDADLEPHEDFIGLYQLDKTSADFITGRIKDVLVRLELSLSRCRGQCFNGASTMRGARNRHEPIMLLKLPIMLLSNASNFFLLCPNYAPLCSIMLT